jgi:hypothetical protein
LLRTASILHSRLNDCLTEFTKHEYMILDSSNIIASQLAHVLSVCLLMD